MEQQHVHLCVTRERLITLPNPQPVRWITDGDIAALAEPLRAGQGRGWSPAEWLELKEQGFLYAGHFRGNRLCSRAGVWERERDVWEVIAVATREGFRRVGLAQAAVHFAADYILDAGRVATYTTTSDNVASIRTALSVGFRPCTKLVGGEKWCATGDRPCDCDGFCALSGK